MNTEARDHAAELAQRIPAGRIGHQNDIAAAAVYLAPRTGDYLVGETLVVDGDWSHARGWRASQRRLGSSHANGD